MRNANLSMLYVFIVWHLFIFLSVWGSNVAFFLCTAFSSVDWSGSTSGRLLTATALRGRVEGRCKNQRLSTGWREAKGFRCLISLFLSSFFLSRLTIFKLLKSFSQTGNISICSPPAAAAPLFFFLFYCFFVLLFSTRQDPQREKHSVFPWRWCEQNTSEKPVCSDL